MATRLQQWIAKLAERVVGRYYEGPEPPVRLAEQVVMFAVANPHATREAWSLFATALAGGAYRSGYVRGFEWAERDLDKLDVGDPAVLASNEAHDYEWHAPEALTTAQLQEVVGGDFLAQLPDDAARAQYLDTVGRYTGGFRVVLVQEKKP
jgi:hypothetical protein